jgi:hypothetical protein
MSAKRINVSLWTLVLVAFGLRVGYCAVTRGLGQVGEGYLEYTVTARRLLLHGTMVSPLPLDDSCSAPSYLMPPGYVGLVTAVYWLFGPETFAAVLIVQIINAAASALVGPQLRPIRRAHIRSRRVHVRAVDGRVSGSRCRPSRRLPPQLPDEQS